MAAQPSLQVSRILENGGIVSYAIPSHSLQLLLTSQIYMGPQLVSGDMISTSLFFMPSTIGYVGNRFLLKFYRIEKTMGRRALSAKHQPASNLKLAIRQP